MSCVSVLEEFNAGIGEMQGAFLADGVEDKPNERKGCSLACCRGGQNVDEPA